MIKIQFHFKLIYLLAIFFVNPWSFAALADEFHEKPYDFLFDNHIDTHQETKLTIKNGQPKRLKGFFYIIFTGKIDSASGLPIARHPRGAAKNEACGDDFDDDFDDDSDDDSDDDFDGDLDDDGGDIECIVGWIMKGKPGEAKFLYHRGVNGNDHPVWMVKRTQIPQPGSYTHFHWIGKDSNDPRAPKAVPTECDVEMAGQLQDNAENIVCPGWFLQIKAVEEFAFDHGGEIVPVRPGFDNATHLNLVTNYAAVEGITSTGSNEDPH